jgi:hypothetical protein
MHGYPRLLATGGHKRPSSAVPVVCRGAPGCEQRALQEVGRKSAPSFSSPHVVRHSAAALAIVGRLSSASCQAQVAKATSATPWWFVSTSVFRRRVPAVALQPGFTRGRREKRSMGFGSSRCTTLCRCTCHRGAAGRVPLARPRLPKQPGLPGLCCESFRVCWVLLQAQVAKSTGTPGCLQPGFTGGTSDCRFSASELSENPTSPAPLADACQHCGRLLSHLVLAYRDSVEDDYRHERPTATVYGPAIRLFHHILRP